MSTVSARRRPIGAEVQSSAGTHFRVWAPDPRNVAVVVEPRAGGFHARVPLERERGGYRAAFVEHAQAGDRYWYELDGVLLPDPASCWQPDGPFGASAIVDPEQYRWTDAAWPGLALRGQVISEVHVGTFTGPGTWLAAMERLPLLRDSGITAVELMPVAEFPGRFGWGYDGVFPFAPTHLYGTPDEFRAFVNRAHELGLGVLLDVVYNHLGPDGCVFREYARGYFTERYRNEWGDALNFDGPGSAPVREYYTTNAAYWIEAFHLDGLRIDATQSMHDTSHPHILAEIAHAARMAAAGRGVLLVAENEPQQVRMIEPIEQGGYGLDALWNDDFHHTAVVALTGRREAYYMDHRGAPQEFVSAARHAYLFQGQRYAWQRKPRGTRAIGLPPAAFVTFIENHDQLANSGSGTRMHARTSPGRYRAMTALLLLMPGTPMLFQGQEFGATSPFLFFADHAPPLAAEVQRGRAEFVAQFTSLASPEVQAQLPDPHDPATFERCKIDWDERSTRRACLSLHEDLLAIRREDLAFRQQAPRAVDGAVLGSESFVLHYFTPEPADERLLVVNFGVDLTLPSLPEPLVAPPPGFGGWATRWSSEHPRYGGLGTPDVVGERGWRIPGHAAVVLRPVPAPS